MPSTVIPGLLYHDAPAAIDWLCRILGFQKRAVAAAPGGAIMHAELTLGDGMIMLGSAAKPLPAIDESDRRGVSLIVGDADAVYARAKAAGARITIELEDKPYGGRGSTCRDPEGYVWHVGTYDPWQPK
jgi:uncharacterized glyoxalase superfamily protein PhnB